MYIPFKVLVSNVNLRPYIAALFYYRDLKPCYAARRDPLVGAGIDVDTGMVYDPLHAMVDSVAVFEAALPRDAVEKLAEDFLCVKSGCYRCSVM